jgi:RNA polymerase subunit RPABC4/transcription elongation factor Spt4
MFCKNCGKELDENARFCSQCGVTVKGTYWEEVSIAADDLIGRIKEILKEGNVRRIVVRTEKGEHLLEIPVTVAAVGTLLAPYLAALGAIAAIATKATIVIERKEKT